MHKDSIKGTRINTEVLGELSEIARNGIKNPRVRPMTSVVSVGVTPNLKYCKVYINVLGSGDTAKATIESLKSAEGYVRKKLAERISLRGTPELKFILNQSTEYGVSMSKLIDEVARGLHQGEGQDEEGEEEEV